MAIFVLLSLGTVAFLYYQNQQLKKLIAGYQLPLVSSSPTPILNEDQEKGFAGYNPKGPKFNIDLPKECVDFVCTTKDFIITINPTEKGMGAASIPTVSNIKLGSYEWERSLFAKDEFATYGLTYDNYYYLIGVVYRPYSLDAQKYFEKILSTFKFINPTSSPSVVPVSQ